MNQIETLKYIAKHGDPKGTPAESDYNNYKSDPTFSKLATQAIEGGNLIIATIKDLIKSPIFLSTITALCTWWVRSCSNKSMQNWANLSKTT